jgi:hypothetical protein
MVKKSGKRTLGRYQQDMSTPPTGKKEAAVERLWKREKRE